MQKTSGGKGRPFDLSTVAGFLRAADSSVLASRVQIEVSRKAIQRSLETVVRNQERIACSRARIMKI